MDDNAQGRTDAAETAGEAGQSVGQTTARIAFAIVAVLGAVFGCTQITKGDDETTTQTDDDIDGIIVDDETAEPTPNSGSVPDPVPEALRVATPSSVKITGPNMIVIEFEGNAKALADSGSLSTFQVTVGASRDTIRATMYYTLENGSPRHTAVLNDQRDAVPTDDGEGTITPGVGGRVEGAWTADNQLTLTIDGFEVPDGGALNAQVFIEETEGGASHLLAP